MHTRTKCKTDLRMGTQFFDTLPHRYIVHNDNAWTESKNEFRVSCPEYLIVFDVEAVHSKSMVSFLISARIWTICTTIHLAYSVWLDPWCKKLKIKCPFKLISSDVNHWCKMTLHNSSFWQFLAQGNASDPYLKCVCIFGIFNKKQANDNISRNRMENNKKKTIWRLICMTSHTFCYQCHISEFRYFARTESCQLRLIFIILRYAIINICVIILMVHYLISLVQLT